MEQTATLCDIRPGQRAVIKELKADNSIHRRFLDIGLVRGTKVECVGRSPAGSPSAFLIRGAVIAIRLEDCRNIIVDRAEGVKDGGAKNNCSSR